MNFSFADFEKIFWKLWNRLYEYLCEVMGAEVNPDWYVPIPDEE